MIKSEKTRKNTIKTNNGTMRTPVTFYGPGLDNSLDGRDGLGEKLYRAYAEVYNPSNKDRQVLTAKGVHRAVTVRIRDPLSSYQPENKQLAKIDDLRYSDIDWQVVDFHPDFQDRQFLVILLGGDQ
ncbi:hypothetical protein [Lactococcus lactis]|jgi:hypothetical protein|uniref:Phage head-tail adapter protein n=2 Tax=Lactococcus lactis TaxID=1358 RepID=A0AAE4T2J4_9LACT|nr:hypothetical protein [Lactococcus lactis]KST92871.1 Phage protein [Lactococcus lactis subsp. lactis]KSU20201.1 Phage protein [Lactococcus lactis subsp. lactis]MBK5077691.1 phage head-tail adapter protein [Lactococcus lactis]MCT2920672.1 phage head-tail adapter protein [Lactococcus lactis]MDG4974302.1 phage head-tail adapter protein [Lactococcus lactis]